MTLIFSYVSETGLLAGSDIVVSRPASPDLPAISLPFREDRLSHESQGHSPVGFSQKSVIFGRTLVQWAGWQIIAVAVVQQIRSMSANGEKQISLAKALEESGLLENELRHVSIIYHYNSSPETIVTEPFNCDVVREEVVICAGSGVSYFFHDLTVEGGNLPSNRLLVEELLGKSLGHSLIEWNGTESLDHLYGGWFEFCYKTESSFSKIPYAIKLWSRSDGVLESGGPVFFGFYSDNTLVVLRLDSSEVDDKVSIEPRFHVISDLLRRDSYPLPPKQSFTPDFIEHIVLEDPLGPHFVYRQPAKSNEMILEVGEHGFRVAHTVGLRERLLNLKPQNSVMKFFPPNFRPDSV